MSDREPDGEKRLKNIQTVKNKSVHKKMRNCTTITTSMEKKKKFHKNKTFWLKGPWDSKSTIQKRETNIERITNASTARTGAFSQIEQLGTMQWSVVKEIRTNDS